MRRLHGYREMPDERQHQANTPDVARVVHACGPSAVGCIASTATSRTRDDQTVRDASVHYPDVWSMVDLEGFYRTEMLRYRNVPAAPGS